MGEEATFKSELTYGYQAEIGSKPPSNLKLFILFEKQMREEEEVVASIREMETQVSRLFVYINMDQVDSMYSTKIL